MTRDMQIVVNVEKPLGEAFQRLALKHGKSGSGFARVLMIKALLDAGLLPAEFMAEILSA